jgi:hypothetical protein
MTLVISKGLTLDNGTRAAAIAGVSPTLDYRFAREKREIETVSLTDKLTYTGGNGTFVGSDGFIQRATTNVPRFDHDPLSRQSLGLLSEVERTNLLLRSEEFNNASWTKSGLLAFGSGSTANAIAAPNGTITADLIVATTATEGHVAVQPTTVIAAFYTFSCYIKAAGYTTATLRTGNAGNFVNGLFDLSAVTVTVTTGGTGANASGSIVPVGDGWYRCSVTANGIGSGGVTNNLIAVGTFAGFPGDGTSGIYIWGAQIEAASTPSTYIPTTTAAVTRTADSAVIDGTGVITGTYTMVEKPAGCAVVSGTNINLQPGFTAERVMVFPAALDAGQITAIRGAM